MVAAVLVLVLANGNTGEGAIAADTGTLAGMAAASGDKDVRVGLDAC